MGNLTHLMFDIETLGLLSDAVTLTIACVPFVFEDYTSFSVLLENRI